MPTARVVLALVLLPLFAAAQAAPAIPKLGETIDVAIANVDVFVTDSAGNRVRGLTEKDFEIFEGGKRQKISNFAEYTTAAGSTTVGGAAPQQATPRQPRTITIFLEKMSLTKDEAEGLTGSLKKVLRSTVSKGDGVSLVLWSRDAAEHVAFTDDLAPVEAALDKYAKDAMSAQFDDSGQQRQTLRANREFEDMVQARIAESSQANRGRTLPGRETRVNSVSTIDETPDLTSSMPTAAVLPMMAAWGEMKVRVAAINSTIDTMAGAEGKKILLLGTRRLGEVAGAEYAFNSGQQRILPDVEQRFGTSELTKSIVDSANASGVTIYPMFPQGLRTTYFDSSVSRVEMPVLDEAPNGAIPFGADNLTLTNETSNLGRIAQQTGGMMASSVADIVKLLPQVASDMSDYYSLAYRIESSATDRGRDIVVKTKNRDYTVRTRRQFVEKSEETRMRDRMTAALFGVTLGSSIELKAEAGQIRDTGNRSALPLAVRIPIKSLTPLPQGETYAGAFSVYVATAADLDELSDFTKNTQPFQFKAADLEKALAGWFTYDLDLVANAKARYAAIGVLDEVSKAWGVLRIPLGPSAETQSATR